MENLLSSFTFAFASIPLFYCAYKKGHNEGKKQGINDTVDYLEEKQIIKFEKEEE